MNRYLRNLVAKNLNQAEVIQPRLAFRFEPMPLDTSPRFKHFPDFEKIETKNFSPSDSIVEDFTQPNLRSDLDFSPLEHDFLNQVTSKEHDIGRIVREQYPHYRLSQPLAEAKSPFPSFDLKMTDRPDDFVSPWSFKSIQKDADFAMMQKQKHMGRSKNHRSEEEDVYLTKSEGRNVTMQSTDEPKKKLISTHEDGILEERSSKQQGKENSKSDQRASEGGIAPRKSAKELKQLASDGIKRIAAETGSKKNVMGISNFEQRPSGEVIAPLQLLEELAPSDSDERKRIAIETSSKKQEIEKSGSQQWTPREEIASPKSNEDIETRMDIERTAPAELDGPLISPRMILAQPTVKKYVQPEKREFNEEMTNPDTKPDVLVTIGRIEVRAIPLATISQRKQEKPPVMSLEEYLKR